MILLLMVIKRGVLIFIMLLTLSLLNFVHLLEAISKKTRAPVPFLLKTVTCVFLILCPAPKNKKHQRTTDLMLPLLLLSSKDLNIILSAACQKSIQLNSHPIHNGVF